MALVRMCWFLSSLALLMAVQHVSSLSEKEDYIEPLDEKIAYMLRNYQGLYSLLISFDVILLTLIFSSYSQVNESAWEQQFPRSAGVGRRFTTNYSTF